MHVLLTNDDGPPNEIASPYIRFLVDAIGKYTDWDLSIVVPDVQRSWIGKAHFAGKELTASFIYPNQNSNVFHGPFPLPNNKKHSDLKEWALIDGTPASCADIGIHHLYQEKGPVDLVISGPNVGKNATASYILSSGTIGAALEGAIHSKKAIGISYGYITRDVPDEVLEKAAEISVKLVKYLYENWGTKEGQKVDLYSINIPLVETLLEKERTKIFYTPILQNRWVSIFKNDDAHIGKSEDIDIVDATASNKIQFKWAPDFDYVHRSIRESTTLNDGKVLDDGNISVTPLRASFDDIATNAEIKLDI
ncbi:hypothetical protein DASC09_035980 [Saccharomycopsis crataegensis]|uniref:Survival protein SurE-like phosphatase/nucleotidase domain-containing protein n=1 Tax=Saccharomycopsis crataegensis TaxID=43959 RepID=A0AAV5QN06_9ASCO|nr:hypothetical protein DASC09_035980 [Saccharomycopsis crataegensis]